MTLPDAGNERSESYAAVTADTAVTAGMAPYVMDLAMTLPVARSPRREDPTKDKGRPEGRPVIRYPCFRASVKLCSC